MEPGGHDTADAARAHSDRFAEARHRVDDFVARTFSFRGTLHLHRRAFGWDILRAPVNVALAPVHLSTRIVAMLLRRLGARRLGDALGSLRILLGTGVAREIEARLLADLFRFGDRPQPVAALLGAPPLQDLLNDAGTHAEAQRRARGAAGAITAYSGVRSAVAEITTAMIALALGALVFQSLTPGMVSMAPNVAGTVAQNMAIAGFPLGERAGALWYGLFPAKASLVGTVATVAVLIAAASCVTAFAGILADPIQARLGIHRRRLLRLVDAVESEVAGTDRGGFAASEHYYARFADVIDAVTGAVRLFR